MRLDNSARMNFPGTVEGNWSWRVGDEKIWGKLAQEAKDLRALCTATDRLPPGQAPCCSCCFVSCSRGVCREDRHWCTAEPQALAGL